MNLDEDDSSLIKQFHRENKLRFEEMDRQRLAYHKEYTQQFKDIRVELKTLTDAFNQAKGGWFVLYALGALVTGIVGIWALVWGIKHT